MNIEIITTPNKDLKESGFGSLSSCNSVLEAVMNMGHNVVLNICKTKEDLLNIVLRQPDLVVLGVKYLSFKDESDVWLSEYFSNHRINYTGSSKDVLRFDSSKVMAKSYLKNRGIKTADFFTAVPGEYKSEVDLPVKFPLFLKPVDAANGNGIDDLSYVTNYEEFESKVLSLYSQYNAPVLVEEYLDGKEYTVSVIQTSSGRLVISPIEIVPLASTNGLKILGHKAKTEDSEELKKIKDNMTKVKLVKMATEVFFGLGIRDYGRIDIKTNKDGECYFMEVNLVPGMTHGSSYFPKSCEIENKFAYDDAVALMLSQGINRIPSNKNINKKVKLNSNFLNGYSIETMMSQSQPSAVNLSL
ncbi:ATP-grasp domain-containing protein [Sulfurimonas sp.]|uniref:ATP-grasp domain-containing protein n=1 Tax=Sulfurimonas sp. TaxID=2022749 RepID=UPI0035637F97